MKKKIKSSTKYVLAYEQRQRALGRTQRKKWANPLDWPAIDRYIKRINAKRENVTHVTKPRKKT